MNVEFVTKLFTRNYTLTNHESCILGRMIDSAPKTHHEEGLHDQHDQICI